MISLIEHPHLPKGKTRDIIIGKKYRNLLENALKERNLAAIWINDNKFVDPRISGHADISVLHAGGNRLFLAAYLNNCEFVDKVRGLGIEPVFVNSPHGEYPDDCGLNLCIISNTLIYNPKSALHTVIKELHCDRNIIVKQGYTKCSVCIADERSIITQDRSIADAAALNGFDVLYIEQPFVRLDGFENGFVGGASFKTAADEIAFTGIIKSCEIRNRIESFLHNKNIKCTYLTDTEIFDIGGAIPITEEFQ